MKTNRQRSSDFCYGFYASERPGDVVPRDPWSRAATPLVTWEVADIGPFEPDTQKQNQAKSEPMPRPLSYASSEWARLSRGSARFRRSARARPGDATFIAKARPREREMEIFALSSPRPARIAPLASGPLPLDTFGGQGYVLP